MMHSVALLLSSLLLLGPAGAGRLRGKDTKTLKAADEALGSSDEAGEQRLEVTRALRQIFEALPKNALGQIPAEAVFPHVVRSYFAKEHGWLLRGLEHPWLLGRVAEVHEAEVLRERAPLLAEVLEDARHTGRGLGLGELAAVIAAMERLVLDDTVPTLTSAYALNNVSVTDEVSESTLHEMLVSYLLIVRQGMSRNLTDASFHENLKAIVRNDTEAWASLSAYEHKAVGASPSASGYYAFPAATQIAKKMARGYGKWQNDECRDMKAGLMELDPSGTGRVPLDIFSNQPEHAQYQFDEKPDYLRSIGALDESEADRPQVLIANYLAGPSNCIASSEFYAVCCLSECDGIRNELEQSLQAPTATPEELLQSLPFSAPTPAPKTADALRAIAGNHRGKVPLYSADFAQWLHEAFPNECPRPTATDRAAEESEGAVLREREEVAPQDCTRVPAWQSEATGQRGDRWSAKMWFHSPEPHRAQQEL